MFHLVDPKTQCLKSAQLLGEMYVLLQFVDFEIAGAVDFNVLENCSKAGWTITIRDDYIGNVEGFHAGHVNFWYALDEAGTQDFYGLSDAF